MNQVALIGRLVKEPELVEVGDNKTPFLKNTIAVNDEYKKDKAHFFVFTLWNQQADFTARYAHKGDLIALTGSLEYHQWETMDGESRSDVRVSGSSISILAHKQESEGKVENTSSEVDNLDNIDICDDELPF